ncbi:MAG TPA: hypothetical protein VFF55_00625 [Candidatus Deferrimicrobium sp.]|nr:hypothetical protein [Candidatus Deferrimicrobium sp.]
MSDPAAPRGLMRSLAVVLAGLWAATALAVATAYRPGGALDIVVALICFGPVLVAAAGVAWPPAAEQHRHRVALIWLWIAALLLAIPVLYGVISTLVTDEQRSLVPSAEAAYAGLLAVFAMALFSLIGFVHDRRAEPVFESRATVLSTALAIAVTALIAAAFVLVVLINDEGLRASRPPRSRYGPTDADLVPPFCDEPIGLGRHAQVTIRAVSSLDDEVRGRAVLTGQRRGIDESWSGSWSGPDGTGRAAYLRIGRQAWLNDATGDQAAPRSAWQETSPDPFDSSGPDRLTMDGPPQAWVDVPRGSIVAEDLGLEVLEGARARHCRTFMDGPTALTRFLPLRWLLRDDSERAEADIRRWRGEMDWWVFGDGELGRAVVEVSGSRADTDWQATGVRAVLRAELDALDRDRAVDLSLSPIAPVLPSGAPEGPSSAPADPLESGAP